MSEKFVYDKSSPDADKYTEVDKFLQLTERYCKKGLGAIASKVGSKLGLKNSSRPYSSLQRAVKIINADGIEGVYDDLMHCTRVERCDIFIGKSYLFRQNNFMCRIKDIKKCYILKEESGDDILYHCYADISDEAGDETLELRKLSALKVQRLLQFDEIRKLIGIEEQE
ncbi:hypothetical protein [Ruminococcus albus]|uniref:Uncharacterized protein n=1 Tax=Ruminococcus albus (strain ATCC 27210 / DSM 20455 / JCM 14654 / NCDO 2250 / 7) TaxID=697329 RepID=E6UG66_RUMA7|nr:hypothetical protein [Ruminococcus albus]ADU21093.1 hypothetical protein Rumal_0544 [Ruminococcus albus 7 = DSM 20455]